MNDNLGQVITFYSYKGGTGRTMALANVACLLARQSTGGQNVLMIDWDLEAPGLPGYFDRFLYQQPAKHNNNAILHEEQPGLIDLLIELDTNIQSMIRGRKKTLTEVEVEKAFNEIDLDDFILRTMIPGLHLLKAGRSSSDYFDRVKKLEWEELYQRAPSLWHILADRLGSRYSYVLVDSRTGRTDISSVCTMLMPTKLVVVFTPNRQSIEGALELCKKAAMIRREFADERPLRIYPLVSRVGMNQEVLQFDWRYGNHDKRIEGFQGLFETLFEEIYGLEHCNMHAYFDSIQIPEVSGYTYGEEIAVLRKTDATNGILGKSYERFADWLVNKDDQTVYGINSLKEGYNALLPYLGGNRHWNSITAIPVTLTDTQQNSLSLLSAARSLSAISNESTHKLNKPKVFISYFSKDENEKNVLKWYLAHLEELGIIGETWDMIQATYGADMDQAFQDALKRSQVAIVLITDEYLRSAHVNIDFPELLKRYKERNLILLPLIAKSCEWRSTGLFDNLRVIPGFFASEEGLSIWGNPYVNAHEQLIKVAVQLARILGTDEDTIRELHSRLNTFCVNAGKVTNSEITQRGNGVNNIDLRIGGNAFFSHNLVTQGNITMDGQSISETRDVPIKLEHPESSAQFRITPPEQISKSITSHEASHQLTDYTSISAAEILQATQPILLILLDVPERDQPEVLKIALALQIEMASGNQVDDERVGELLIDLIRLLPNAAAAINRAFEHPLIAPNVGAVTKFVLKRLGK